jgi:hypothetical protein
VWGPSLTKRSEVYDMLKQSDHFPNNAMVIMNRKVCRSLQRISGW